MGRAGRTGGLSALTRGPLPLRPGRQSHGGGQDRAGAAGRRRKERPRGKKEEERPNPHADTRRRRAGRGEAGPGAGDAGRGSRRPRPGAAEAARLLAASIGEVLLPPHVLSQ